LKHALDTAPALNRFLAHLSPASVAGLSARGCQLALLVDQANNDLSFRRQSQLDTAKTATELAAEGPTSAAALLSLAGVNAVALNQWASTFNANARLLTRAMDGMVKGKLLLVESVRAAAQAPITLPRPPPVASASAKGTAGIKTAKAAAPTGGEMVTLRAKMRVAYNTVVYGVPSFVVV
jgi:hypothetical protein